MSRDLQLKPAAAAGAGTAASPKTRQSSAAAGASWLAMATTPPKPAPTMDANTAFGIVRAAYGHHRTMSPGKVVFVGSFPELWKRADDYNTTHKAQIPAERRLWQPGDAEKQIGESGQGFTEPDTKTAYLPKEGVLPETTVHEMLHINGSDEFRKRVGVFVNEGVTQVLALRALKMQGRGVPEDQAYVENVEVVRELERAVGSWVVEHSFFCGPEPLVAALNRVCAIPSDREGYTRYGEQAALQVFLDLLRSDDGLDAVKKFLRQSTSATRSSAEAEQRVRAIQSHLGGWWVSEADVTAIVGVLRSCPNEAVASEVAAGVRPLLSRVSDPKQRARIMSEF